MSMTHTRVQQWVDETARLTQPDRIVWLNGSDQEYADLLAEAVRQQQLIPLNVQRHPGCYLHRSDPRDVARTERCTYICTPTQEEAGPTNNWMAPEHAYATLRALSTGAMRGRTMYVVPFLLGPEDSSFARVGIELTDSVYVAVSMRLMTRMGMVALNSLDRSVVWFKGIHVTGTLDPEQRYICHVPQDLTVWSVNSAYGGNALLSKKCVALRLGSWLGQREGWMAEHMCLMGIENPQGRTTYVAAALPSACGKTNLAMLRPTGAYAGWRVWCLGDDIAWLRPGDDGRLYAVNPEAGFFGVAPGTNAKTNPHMMTTIARNSLFTNVAVSPDGTVWWEGLERPSNTDGWVDWQNQPWTFSSGRPGAHPNSRFTASLPQCPVLSPEWHNPRGVPVSAILFGCRRSRLVPLVCEAFTWQHGVYLGATLDSETTAAADGATGVVRRDPMAMRPFCGTNMADYFSHWLAIGQRLRQPPRIYRVNWFRVDNQGRLIWPGFGENMRVLSWIVERCTGTGAAVETPLGHVPDVAAFDLNGAPITAEALAGLLAVDRDGWIEAARQQEFFFDQFGTRLPQALRHEQQALIRRLTAHR